MFFGLRLVLMLFAASLLTLTTTTLDLTDAFEVLLAPLARLRFPAHEFAMIMGIALRFLPQFVNELRSIRAAQLSRGARGDAHPLAGGLRTIASLIVPLVASAFRHAETLSSGMEARCYHGAGGRTRLAPLVLRAPDAAAALAIACMLVACALASMPS